MSHVTALSAVSLFRVGSDCGLKFATDRDNTWHQYGNESDVEKDLETIVGEFKKAKMKLELIIVLLSSYVSLYKYVQ